MPSCANFDERILKEKVTEEELDELFFDYVHKYVDYLPSYIIDHLSEDYLTGLNDGYASCYVRQFYDENNLMKKEFNYYALFEDLVKRNYPDLKDRTVLDLGGGIVPVLGRRIAKEAKHVIVVDENLAPIDNPSNLETIQCHVEDVRKLPKADLIVGFMPCEATRLIAEYAAYYKSDFILELCGCIHDDNSYYSEYFDSMRGVYYESYVNKVKSTAEQKIKESGIGKLKEYKVTRFPFRMIGNKRV